MTNYRTYLKHQLAERCRTNPHYSLRAFARDLGISPSILSEVLNGKHGLSTKKAKIVAQKLGLNDHEQKEFLTLVHAQSARSLEVRKHALEVLQNQQELKESALSAHSLSLDHYQIIADSHHFMIVEYLQIPKMSHDVKDIAKALKLSVHVAQASIERLLRLEMIEKRQEGYKVLNPLYVSPTGIPSEAIRKSHKQILDRAADALTLQSLDQREFRALTFAVNKKNIPVLKTKIQQFIREINEQELAETQKDSVYMLAVQLFEAADSHQMEKNK